MEDMEAPWQAPVDRFCRQYLQLESDPDLPPSDWLQLPDVQEAIYDQVFAAGAVRYGPPVRYQHRILKKLVARIESSIDDWDEYAVSDNLMSALSELVATPLPSESDAVQQKCHVTYHLSLLRSSERRQLSSQKSQITLLENRSLISAGGTTGLRTWEAALHLGQFLCENPNLVTGKRVLELGAGTGYLSIMCAKHLRATHVIASDGSDDVINNLPDNMFLNSLQDSQSIIPMDIKWGHALLGTEEEAWNGGLPVDVVLGADITYDQSVIPALVGTLLDLFELYPQVEVFISATQRNQVTFQVFLDSCQTNRLGVDDLQYSVPKWPAQTGPFYNDSVEIRTCKIYKS